MIFPLDLGANRRGVDMAPSAIRIAGMAERLKNIGHEVTDEGDLEVFVPEVLKIEDPKLKYLPEISKSVTHLADEVTRALENGQFPLVLGGDHSIAVGSISGAARFLKKKRKHSLCCRQIHPCVMTWNQLCKNLKRLQIKNEKIELNLVLGYQKSFLI